MNCFGEVLVANTGNTIFFMVAVLLGIFLLGVWSGHMIYTPDRDRAIKDLKEEVSFLTNQAKYFEANGFWTRNCDYNQHHDVTCDLINSVARDIMEISRIRAMNMSREEDKKILKNK